MSLFVPTKFVWRFGGNTVHLCGSFTRWVETVPMAPVDGQPGVYSVVVHLPPGYHQYKFIVDGEWRHDETQPFMPDPLGNVNNWLFVRKPDGSGSSTPTAAATAAGQGLPAASLAGVQRAPQQGQAQHHSAPQHLAAAAQQAHAQLHQPQAAAGSLAAAAAGLGAGGTGSQGGALQHAGQRAAAGGGQVTAPSSRTQSVADMDVSVAGPAPVDSGVDGVIAPIALQADEPGYTRKKVADFLNAHTAYELIPESGKVVLLDVDLPMRQAFHALNEQGIASAPLWDGSTAQVCGMLSASDFIRTLQRLRSVVAGTTPMSEGEMDRHTIRMLRDELQTSEGRLPKALVYVKPQESLAAVVRTLFEAHCSAAPLLHCEPRGAAGGAATASNGRGPTGGEVLHTATTAGVLACLMRHFRASLASLPLLAQPLCALPVGTWDESSPLGQAALAEQQQQQQGDGGSSKERRDKRRVVRLQTVRPDTPLTQALGILLESGISCLPVVDDGGVLLDVYARADITMLARGNAYTRLQYEDVTVGQALALAAQPLPPPQAHHPFGSAGGSTPSSSSGDLAAAFARQQRVHMCTSRDSLRSVVERLSVPGVRRLVAVDPDSRRVEGIVSLSDVAAYLLL